MAAGQGFKTFATGDVLSAADVNGYLMQGVLVFADSAERDAEITSPEEGQFAYLKDTNVTTYYTGSVWANLDTTGMTNPMTTTGDVIYSSSGSTPARLGLGTAGQVLQVNSGATAPEWATASSGLSAASQAEMEAASSTTVAVTPGRAQYHPSAAKFWVKFNGTGTPAINASYNMTSITDNGAGYYTINIGVDFSSGNYCVVANAEKLSGASSTSTLTGTCMVPAYNAGDFGLITYNLVGTLSDCSAVFAAGYGDQ
jgi:hypothetical protein